MSDRWAVELAEIFRGVPSDGKLFMFGKIYTSRPQPIRLYINDQIIEKNLFINVGLSVQVGDEVLVMQSGNSFYILLKVMPV
ncbi:hypothetical protein AALA82_14560 [Oscillospiraceae bacterium 50-16]